MKAIALTHPPLPPGTRFVDVFVIDVNGMPRGKRIPAAAWPDAVTAGVAFSASALVLDARGHAQGPLGIGTADGDPDAVGYPVPGLLHPVPWAEQAVAQSLLAMRSADGAALFFDPRAVLAHVVDRCRADGLHPVVACELEFYLVATDAAGKPHPPALPRSGARAGNAGHLCLQTIEDHGAFLHGLADALAAQNIDGGALVSEYGPGQFELNLAHGPDPVRAADQAVLQRRAALGVAARHGMRASFMAKPYAQETGSGLHVHVSLVDEAGRNRFGAAGGEVLLEQAVAGLQQLHAQSMAIFAPSFSAWRRFRPGSFAPLGRDWGADNRSVAFRIPRGGAASRRIEHRVAGADASPHLVLAAVLAGMHHGITHRLRPTPPASGNADRPPPDAAQPADLFAALAALEAGAELASYLPPRFPALFAALKRAEARDLLSEVMPIEHEFYL